MNDPTICPRCNRSLDPRPAMNAVSRYDNATYICSQCGTKEAMADHQGLELPPVDQPVTSDPPASPRNIRCPVCGAPSGSPCTMPNNTGRVPMAGYHYARSDRAAGWT